MPTLALGMLGALGLSGAQAAGGPVQVVETVFDAARKDDPSKLSGLCDPMKENDKDTQRICDLTRENRKWPNFVRWFSKGRVVGEAIIEGDRASVKILFGPDGTKKETFKLVRRDGQWYLMSL